MFIETDRVIVRDFKPEDASDLQEIFGDPETMKNCEPPYDLAKTKTFLQDFCIARHGGLAAALKDGGKLIGYILFNEIEPRVYEMGWIFNRRFWRNGYAYEACRAVMAEAFTCGNAHKIFAEAIDGIKSVGLMEKLGMRLEGVQREQTDDNSGRLVDLYLYGVLRKEWRTL